VRLAQRARLNGPFASTPAFFSSERNRVGRERPLVEPDARLLRIYLDIGRIGTRVVMAKVTTNRPSRGERESATTIRK